MRNALLASQKKTSFAPVQEERKTHPRHQAVKLYCVKHHRTNYGNSNATVKIRKIENNTMLCKNNYMQAPNNNHGLQIFVVLISYC